MERSSLDGKRGRVRAGREPVGCLDPGSEDWCSLEGCPGGHRPIAGRDSRRCDRYQQLHPTFGQLKSAGCSTGRCDADSSAVRRFGGSKRTPLTVGEGIFVSYAARGFISKPKAGGIIQTRCVAPSSPRCPAAATSTEYMRRPAEPVGLQLLRRRLHQQATVELLHVFRLHRRLLVEHKRIRGRVRGWHLQSLRRPIGRVLTSWRRMATPLCLTPTTNQPPRARMLLVRPRWSLAPKAGL